LSFPSPMRRQHCAHELSSIFYFPNCLPPSQPPFSTHICSIAFATRAVQYLSQFDSSQHLSTLTEALKPLETYTAPQSVKHNPADITFNKMNYQSHQVYDAMTDETLLASGLTIERIKAHIASLSMHRDINSDGPKASEDQKLVPPAPVSPATPEEHANAEVGSVVRTSQRARRLPKRYQDPSPSPSPTPTPTKTRSRRRRALVPSSPQLDVGKASELLLRLVQDTSESGMSEPV